jgi:hypothetical protein
VEDPTHYETLGLSPTSTIDEIRSAYRQLIRMHHPDLTGGAGQAITLRLNAAKHTLLDPERRADYDRTLVPRMRAATVGTAERPVSHRPAARESGSHPVLTSLSLGGLAGLVAATAIIFALCYRAPFALDNPRLLPLIGIAVAWVNLGMRKPPTLIRLAGWGSGLLFPLFAAGVPVASRFADAVSPLVLVALFVASAAVAVARFSSRRASVTGPLRHAGGGRIGFDRSHRMS